jgi:hypothetical protein
MNPNCSAVFRFTCFPRTSIFPQEHLTVSVVTIIILREKEFNRYKKGQMAFFYKKNLLSFVSTKAKQYVTLYQLARFYPVTLYPGLPLLSGNIPALLSQGDKGSPQKFMDPDHKVRTAIQ